MNRQRFKDLLAQYGRVAVVTYFVIFAAVFAGFAVAMSLGFAVESAGASAGLLGAAYLATKLTQPLRILGTVLLTPPIAAVLAKLGRTRASSDERDAGDA